MEQVVRTIYGSKLQTASLLGVPYEVDEHSTLNELFQVQTDALINDTEYPRMQFLAIGNGGHKVVTGADGIPYTKIKQHEPDHAAPFKPLPFVLRQLGDDLTPQERAKYAMRCVRTFNGDTYYAYYLKRLDMTNVTPRMQKRVVQDGQTTSTDFVPQPSNLVPVADDLENVGTNPLLAEYLTVSALLPVIFSEADCTELLNVSRIIFGDDVYAILSELCLVSAANKVIGLTDGSNFKEAIAAQVVSFIGAFHQVKYTASGITGLFDVGTNEPLFSPTTNVPVIP